MGKSASGKDTIYKRLLACESLDLKKIVTYTTRPIRTSEKEGVEYHFVTEEDFFRLQGENKVIEFRVYHTVLGDWTYFMAADGQIKPEQLDYLLLNTLEGYESIKSYYGEDRVVPIYIEVEDGLRLHRAVERERQQKEPKYAELCRRYLADELDFSKEKLAAAGIRKSYVNENLEECISQVIADIQKQKNVLE
jgi:guanylate kinase